MCVCACLALCLCACVLVCLCASVSVCEEEGEGCKLHILMCLLMYCKIVKESLSNAQGMMAHKMFSYKQVISKVS